MTIGENIKSRRTELGLTQDELAKKAGYKSRSSINKIELSRDLPLKKVEDVAKALGCSPAELCGWNTDKQPVIKDNSTGSENKPGMIAVGQKIRAMRNQCNITQTELAKRLGYADKGMVSRVENGLVDLSCSKIMMLAEIFECDASTLLGEEKRQAPTRDTYSQKERDLVRCYRGLSNAAKGMVDKMLGI